MRRVGLCLLILLLSISCAKQEYVINTARLEQSCIDDVNSVKLFFDISQDDEYQLEVRDQYSLIWNSKLQLTNGDYESDDLIIPYTIEGGKLDYKVISQSGKYLEASIPLNDVEPCIWCFEDGLLMPKKEIKSRITMFKGLSSTVTQTSEPLLIEDGVDKIKVEYTYQGVFYSFYLTI